MPHELLSREDLQKMLEKVRQTAPTVVDDLKPDLIRMGVVHQVLVNLLSEGIPVTNLPLILESLVHHAAYVKEPVQLTERVRGDIGRTICDRFRDERGRVRVLVLEPQLEMALRDSVREGSMALQPANLEKLIGELNGEWRKACVQGLPLALLADGSIRRLLRQAIVRALPDLAVVAYHEVPGDLLIEPVAMLRLGDVFPAAAAVKRSDGAVHNPGRKEGLLGHLAAA